MVAEIDNIIESEVAEALEAALISPTSTSPPPTATVSPSPPPTATTASNTAITCGVCKLEALEFITCIQCLKCVHFTCNIPKVSPYYKTKPGNFKCQMCRTK